MANAYCLWRCSKSPMQSNLSLDSLSLLFTPPVSYICSAELSLCVCPTIPAPLPSLRGHKLILSCIKRREASHFSYPAATSLFLDISISLFLHISLISHSLASNDIYAILIEYLLYMRLHIQAFSLPLLNTISHTFAWLQCL